MIWTTHFFSLLALAASLPLSDSDSESTKNLDNWSVYITNPDETTTWQPGGSYPVQWSIDPGLPAGSKYDGAIVIIGTGSANTTDIVEVGYFDLQNMQATATVPADFYTAPGLGVITEPSYAIALVTWTLEVQSQPFTIAPPEN